VKPDIVFFGEGLPSKFFESRTSIPSADLAIILGTSLSVAPFSALPQFFTEGVPRLLVNMERVGGLGARLDDVLLLGDCDSGIRTLAAELGWLEELEEKWTKTAPKEAAELGKQRNAEEDIENAKSKDEKLEDEVNKLTKEIDEALKIGDIELPKDKPGFSPSQNKDQIGIEGGPQAKPTVAVNNAPATVTETPIQDSGSLGNVISNMNDKSTL